MFGPASQARDSGFGRRILCLTAGEHQNHVGAVREPPLRFVRWMVREAGARRWWLGGTGMEATAGNGGSQHDYILEAEKTRTAKTAVHATDNGGKAAGFVKALGNPASFLIILICCTEFLAASATASPANEPGFANYPKDPRRQDGQKESRAEAHPCEQKGGFP